MSVCGGSAPPDPPVVAVGTGLDGAGLDGGGLASVESVTGAAMAAVEDDAAGDGRPLGRAGVLLLPGVVRRVALND